jgi:hypothetical protein
MPPQHDSGMILSGAGGYRDRAVFGHKPRLLGSCRLQAADQAGEQCGLGAGGSEGIARPAGGLLHIALRACCATGNALDNAEFAKAKE